MAMEVCTTRKQRTLRGILALIEALQAVDAPIHVEYCNMALKAYLINGDDQGAVAYIARMHSDE